MIQIPFSRPIAYHPSFAVAFGGIEEAIFIQQLLYWADKGIREDGFIYKTKTEWEEETYLTRRQLDRLVKKFTEGGYIETQLIKVNGAPITHYRVNEDAVQNVLLDLYKTYKSNCTKGTKPPIQRLHTESTSSSKVEPCTVEANKGNGSLIPLVIKEMETIDPKNKRFYGNKTQREACDFLITEYGLDLVVQVIKAIPTLKAKLPYMPSVTTPVELRDKWVKIKDAIQRNKAKEPEVVFTP